jgi:hypothetical protein
MRRVLLMLFLTMGAMVLLSACHGGEHYTFVVDGAGDAPDDQPGDGVCDAGGGECTLRAAIDESNALSAAAPAGGFSDLPVLAESHAAGAPSITIELQTDTFLEIANDTSFPAPPDHTMGDLDISADVSIQGNGHTLDASGLDRAFHVHDGTVTFANLTITGGRSYSGDVLGGEPIGDGTGGGGIRTETGTDVRIVGSTLRDNQFDGPTGCQLPPPEDPFGLCMPSSTTQGYGGGAIESNGTLRVVGSTFAVNASQSVLLVGGPICNVCPASYGGAILSNGPLTVLLSTFDDNNARQQDSPAPNPSLEGSAIAQFGPSTSIIASTFVDNGSGSAAFPLVDYRRLWSEELSTTYPFNLPARASIVRGGYCSPLGATKFNACSPSVGALTDNGGLTDTRLPGSGARDLIPAGTPALCDGTLPFDQRGLPRPTGTACDVGSVER